jgi:raffinose/stachyose/melibiose transport system substrate-binding protein
MESAEGPVTITWWSHWANEPAKRETIEKIAADYEIEHPNVDIAVTWWDKNPLRDAIRSTMLAGEGAPDITTFDTPVVEWVEAGWLLDLGDTLPWENFMAAAKEDGNYAGIDGNYKFNIGATVNMLLYNKEIFAELGIEVPEDFQFTQSEFAEVVRKCNEAGYAGVANAIGNRPHTGRRVIEDMLMPVVGYEEFGEYIRGEQSWDTPEVRQLLNYSVELGEAGLWPGSFATMTIDEYHVYFHTQREACMLFNPTWYTGRAFKAVEEGGQDPNWAFGMLRPPLLDGAQFPNMVRGGFESGYAVLSQTQHPEVAKDILAFASQPKYGALWVAVTNSPTAILYDKATDWPSAEVLAELGVEAGTWDWYWDEFNMVYGPADVGVTNESWCGDFGDAEVSAINEGIPLDLMTVDEAIALMDSNLCQ